MRKISLFKKIKFFREYLKMVKSKRVELFDNFGSRLDSVGRIYTVVNVPLDSFGDSFNLKKSDIDGVSKSYIDEYRVKISKYLNSIGLIELYSEYEVRKVSKYSYLIVYGYSLFRSDKVYKTILYKVLPLLILLISIFIITFL
jgi:hypothetical protein